MKIKQIDKAKKIYDNIVSLDTQIKTLEKNFKKVFEKDENISLSMYFEKEESKKQNILDEDGSIVLSVNPFSFMERMHGSFIQSSQSYIKEKESFKLDFDTSESALLMATVLEIKQRKRINLINELKDLGFDV